MLTLGEIAQACGGTLADSALCGRAIRGVATLRDAGPDEITWLSEQKLRSALTETRAAAIVGPDPLVGEHPRGLVVEDAELAIARILALFAAPASAPPAGIHPSAVVDSTARLGRNVAVGPLAVIGAECQIGDGTVIHSGVTIGRAVKIGTACVLHPRCVIYDRCELGERVILHAGVVVGADGFGYIFRDGIHRKVPHAGSVVIEDDVEVGANSCIDRAKVGVTRIGRGTKIDDLVMVAHNVQIGPLCLLAGQAGLSGSVLLGTGVALGGQVGVSHGVRIGDGAQIGAQSGVIGDVAPGQAVLSFPARDRMEVWRELARLRKLPALFDEVAELSRRVTELEAAADNPEPG